MKTKTGSLAMHYAKFTRRMFRIEKQSRVRRLLIYAQLFKKASFAYFLNDENWI